MCIYCIACRVVVGLAREREREEREREYYRSRKICADSSSVSDHEFKRVSRVRFRLLREIDSRE